MRRMIRVGSMNIIRSIGFLHKINKNSFQIRGFIVRIDQQCRFKSSISDDNRKGTVPFTNG